MGPNRVFCVSELGGFSLYISVGEHYSPSIFLNLFFIFYQQPHKLVYCYCSQPQSQKAEGGTLTCRLNINRTFPVGSAAAAESQHSHAALCKRARGVRDSVWVNGGTKLGSVS